jgi:hypothetical protein
MQNNKQSANVQGPGGCDTKWQISGPNFNFLYLFISVPKIPTRTGLDCVKILDNECFMLGAL